MFDSEEKGILASNVPALAKIQGKLLNIEEGIEELKETSKEIQQATGDIKKDTESLIIGHNEIAGSLEQIASGFEVLKKSGRIIANPETPAEWYNNAIKHAEGGNYLEARKAYHKFMGYNLSYVDVIEGFVSLMRVTDGPEGVRETLERLLRQQSDNPAMRYGKIITLHGEKRIAALENEWKETGDPIFAFLILEDVIDRTANFTWTTTIEMDLDMRRKVLELGELALDDSVEAILYRSFLDKQAFYQRIQKLRDAIKQNETLLEQGGLLWMAYLKHTQERQYDQAKLALEMLMQYKGERIDILKSYGLCIIYSEESLTEGANQILEMSKEKGSPAWRCLPFAISISSKRGFIYGGYREFGWSRENYMLQVEKLANDFPDYLPAQATAILVFDSIQGSGNSRKEIDSARKKGVKILQSFKDKYTVKKWYSHFYSNSNAEDWLDRLEQAASDRLIFRIFDRR